MKTKMKLGIVISSVVLLLVLGGYYWLTQNDDDYDQDNPIALTLDKAQIAAAISTVKAYPRFQTFAGENIKVFTFRVKDVSDKGEVTVDATRWAGSTAFVYRFYVGPNQDSCRSACELFPLDRAYLTAFHSPELQKFIQNKDDRLVFKTVMPPDKENPSLFVISVIEIVAHGSPVTDELNVDIQTGQVKEVDI